MKLTAVLLMFCPVPSLLLGLQPVRCPGVADVQLPALIPRDVVFGNEQKQLPQISPDGTRLAYLAPEKDVLNVWIKTIGKQDDAPLTRESHRPIAIYRWASDSEHILYQQDSDGDENWHIYSADLKSKHTRDLTPFLGIKAQNLVTSSKRPNEILVGLNLRDSDPVTCGGHAAHEPLCLLLHQPNFVLQSGVADSESPREQETDC